MKNHLKKFLDGYIAFRDKYVHGDQSVMKMLSQEGQNPDVMVISCCDSRVDPALILQCDPGDLFVVRNVANIVPRYTKSSTYQGTSAALEFGVCYLNVKAIVLLGHSQCGGIDALLCKDDARQTDFIKNWVSLVKNEAKTQLSADEYAKYALKESYKNCLTFPWIKDRVESGNLDIYLWFFDIKTGQLFTSCNEQKQYEPLDTCNLEEV